MLLNKKKKKKKKKHLGVTGNWYKKGWWRFWLKRNKKYTNITELQKHAFLFLSAINWFMCM